MKYGDLIAQANPSQNHWELNQLLLNLEEFEIGNVLDIGIHRGGSMKVWRSVFNPKILIGIDSKIHPDAKIDFSSCLLVEGRSQSIEVFDKVKNILNKKELDFLFIDGGHLYDEVKKDFELYSSLVRKGGAIGFHDVMIENNEIFCNVKVFWDEIKKNYKTITIWDGESTGTGEGLIFL